MSADDEQLGLDEAYAVETPDDNRRLYAQWANTFEADFIEPQGYVYHLRVVELFVAAGGSGPVLDVGAGTGIVGAALRAARCSPVDAVDISPEMLAQAEAKRTDDDEPVFRELVVADLTQGMPLEDATYSGIVSVGTFTHGHLGPAVMHELYRVAAPGAHLAIGVNAEHYEERGFAAHFAEAVAEGLISEPTHDDVRIYTATTGAHADDIARVVRFRRS
jgi:SAM-dependent methyltransferase